MSHLHNVACSGKQVVHRTLIIKRGVRFTHFWLLVLYSLLESPAFELQVVPDNAG